MSNRISGQPEFREVKVRFEEPESAAIRLSVFFFWSLGCVVIGAAVALLLKGN